MRWQTIFSPWNWGHRKWLALSAIPILFMVYLMSQAPVMRFRKPMPWDGTLKWCYAPADWIYDNTPLQKPLVSWAHHWGVDGDIEERRQLRHLDKIWKF